LHQRVELGLVWEYPYLIKGVYGDVGCSKLLLGFCGLTIRPLRASGVNGADWFTIVPGTGSWLMLKS